MKNSFKILIAIALVAVMAIGFAPTAMAAERVATEPSDIYTLIEGLEQTQGAKDVREEYRLTQQTDVAYGKIYKFLQVSNGYDVYGSDLIVSVNHDGKVLSANGDYIHVPELTQNFTEQQAIVALSALHGGCGIMSVNKLVYALDTAPELAYDIVINNDGGLRYFVSAVDGEILFSCPAQSINSGVPLTQTDAYGNQIEIEVEYNAYYDAYALVDFTRNIFTFDAKNTTETWSNEYLQDTNGVFDPVAVTAFDSIVKAYDFYTDADNIGVSLKGIDNRNDDISDNYDTRQEVIVTVYVHYDRNLENAFCQYYPQYNQALICIGDGNSRGQFVSPIKSFDVLAHEYQHAVTAIAAGLNYVNDSGALNEAFSDIFGALVEGKEGDGFWSIGEDGVNTQWGMKDLRSMDGTSRGQVYHNDSKLVCSLDSHNQNNQHNEECDNGGVHYNSTIISHVQYKVSQEMPEYFTHDRIGTLWYTTLCALDENSTFEDFAISFYQSAVNLGFTQEACSAIYTALEDSGLMPEDAFHTVTFVDYDDTVILEKQVFHGTSLSYDDYPADPVREADQQYTYRFSGWNGDINNVTEDRVVRAEYNVILRSYTITLMGMDGVISTMKRDYGAAFNPATLSEPASPGQYFVFNGWFLDEEGTTPAESTTISGDLTLYAKWTDNTPEPEPQPDPNQPSDTPSDEGKNCNTVAFGFGGGNGGTGLMIGLFAVLCLGAFIVLKRNKKSFN